MKNQIKEWTFAFFLFLPTVSLPFILPWISQFSGNELYGKETGHSAVNLSFYYPNGRKFEPKENSYSLIFFGFTSCPTICPRAIEVMKSVQQQTYSVRPVLYFVTIDPENDNRHVLEEFGKHHPEIIPLTQNEKETQKNLQMLNGFILSDKGEKIHSSHIYLVTPGGITYLYPYASPDPKKMAQDIDKIFSTLTKKE